MVGGQKTIKDHKLVSILKKHSKDQMNGLKCEHVAELSSGE